MVHTVTRAIGRTRVEIVGGTTAAGKNERQKKKKKTNERTNERTNDIRSSKNRFHGVLRA
jgi:hypothetical protein